MLYNHEQDSGGKNSLKQDEKNISYCTCQDSRKPTRDAATKQYKCKEEAEDSSSGTVVGTSTGAVVEASVLVAGESAVFARI